MKYVGWLVESPGDRFQQADLSRPRLVLVKIAPSGVNPLAIKISAGQATHAKQTLWAVLGLDMAGTVEEVGANLSAFEVASESMDYFIYREIDDAGRDR